MGIETSPIRARYAQNAINGNKLARYASGRLISRSEGVMKQPTKNYD